MEENTRDEIQVTDGVEVLKGENQRLRGMLTSLTEELSQLREDNDYLVFRTEHLEEINGMLQEKMDSYMRNLKWTA